MLPIRADLPGMERHAAPLAEAPEPIASSLVAALFRHRLLICLSALLVGGLGAGYSLYVKPVYEAVSTVGFERETVDLPQLLQAQYSENVITTEMEVLRGRSAAEAVVDSLALRARLIAPRRGRITQLFSVLHVSPTADSTTLVFHAGRSGVFNISHSDSTATIGSVRIGDTTTVAGVRLAPTRAALDVPELRLRIDQADEGIRRFRSGLNVSRPGLQVDMIAIRTRTSDPVLAAAAANLLAANIIASRQSLRRARTNAAAAFLREQADSLRRQLRDAEDGLRIYQERAHVVDAPTQARSQVERLTALQADLAAVRAERDAFAALVRQVGSDTTGHSTGGSSASRLMAFPSLLRSQSTSALLSALAQAENDRSALLMRRVPGDSDVQVLTGRIRDIEAQLQSIGESFLQSLSNQVTSLEAEGRQLGLRLDSLPEKELQMARRESDTKVLNDLWVLVQTRLKEAEITSAVGDPSIHLVDAAALPTAPVRPRLLVNTVLSLILGSLFGIIAALAVDHRDRSVRSRADVLAAAGLQVLGAIPRVNRQRRLGPWWRPSRAHKNRRLRNGTASVAVSVAVRRTVGPEPERERPGYTFFEALPGPRDQGGHAGQCTTDADSAAKIASLLVTQPGTPPAYIESFNQLFANLALVYRERALKVIVFASALPGDGKTLTATNFALIGASRGLRMLLIDADMRCGLASAVLGCTGVPGLAELLDGTVQIGEALCRVTVGERTSLMMVPSGALPRAAGRLLTVDRVHKILDTLAPDFDFIVIDTPPVNLLADAALLASGADAVLLVVRAGRTHAADVRYAMDQLEATHAPVLGALLNDIDLRRHASDDDAYRYIAGVERYAASAD